MEIGEKFYPTFYKAVSEELLAFKNLSKRCSVLLGVAFQPVEFTLKERNIVNYLSGYLFLPHCTDV